MMARGGENSLLSWFNTFQMLQACEVWAYHGEWLDQVNPFVGPGIQDRSQVPKP